MKTKKDYKKIWKKLKIAVKEDLLVTHKCINEKSNAGSPEALGEAIHNMGIRDMCEWLLTAMEELEGTKHHNIFTYKKEK